MVLVLAGEGIKGETTADFQSILEAARSHFPDDRVWGAPLHAGRGFGIFVEREGITVCLQAKNTLMLNGEAIEYDIRDHGDNIGTALKSGFEDMEKNLRKLIAKKPKPLSGLKGFLHWLINS